MNKKILSLIILFLGVFSVMQAQNDGKIRVKGVVLDETTRQPIAFANIKFGYFLPIAKYSIIVNNSIGKNNSFKCSHVLSFTAEKVPIIRFSPLHS